jgi:4-hydroxybenzoate polyprenyltransferase
MPYLKLIRFKNLLIIAVTQWLFKWMLIDVFFKTNALSSIEFTMLVLATICLAAAGNIINDIQDVRIDRINKHKKVIIGKKIQEKTAYNMYVFFNITGVALGIYVANSSNKPGFAVIFVIIALLLYYYSVKLKKIPLAGNLLISVLVGVTVLITGLFTILPIATESNRYIVNYVFRILYLYSFFAAYLNFLRELIKDVEDVDGDYAGEVRSVPILLGKLRTLRLVSVLSILPCILLLWAAYLFLHQYPLLNAYVLFMLMGPLLYIAINSWNSKKKKEYRRLHMLLKLVMVLGVLSIIMVRYTMFNKM